MSDIFDEWNTSESDDPISIKCRYIIVCGYNFVFFFFSSAFHNQNHEFNIRCTIWWETRNKLLDWWHFSSFCLKMSGKLSFFMFRHSWALWLILNQSKMWWNLSTIYFFFFFCKNQIYYWNTSIEANCVQFEEKFFTRFVLRKCIAISFPIG